MRWMIAPLMLMVLDARAQQWMPLPEMPGMARDDAAAFTANGSIYIGTGMTTGWQLASDVWRYDVNTQTWSVAPAFPGSPRQYCTGFETGGFGYVFGGLDAGGLLSELWVHLPVNAVWYQLASMPAAPRMASSVMVIGYRVFIIGGRTGPGTQATQEVWEYRPFLNVWEQKTDFPGIAREQAAAFTVGNYGYLAGGQDANGNRLNDTWRYEPTTDSWTPMAVLPAAGRSGATGIGLATSGLVICGSTAPNAFTDEVWRYQPGLDSWEAAPSFPGGARKGGVGGVWEGAYAYYGTGSDAQQRFADWYGFGMDVSIPEVQPRPMQLFPIPATDRIHVRPIPRSGSQVILFDHAGRKVMEVRSDADGSIDIEALEPGPYQLRLIDAEGVHVRPFIRTR